MKILSCINCGTQDKGYKSKRCQSCFTSYYGSEEWAKSEEEIERRKKISTNNARTTLGTHRSAETKRKIGLIHLGNKYNWKGGKPKCIDCFVQLKGYKAQRCIKCLGINKRGENHFAWKGGISRKNTDYRYLHNWINKSLWKSPQCEFCERDGLSGHQIHWANKSREYKKELTDWLRLCVKCHKAYDRNQLELV